MTFRLFAGLLLLAARGAVSYGALELVSLWAQTHRCLTFAGAGLLFITGCGACELASR